MNTSGCCGQILHGLKLLLLALFACACPDARAQEETFPVIQIGTQMYTNVTVTTKAKKYIFITHSTGMANIKVEELPGELQEKLGYAAPGAGGKGARGAVAAWTKDKMALVNTPQVRAAEQQLQETWREHAAGNLPKLRAANPLLIYAALGVVLLIYLFFCYCAKLICDKTGKPAGILIWLPGLQMFPLLRAAGMSGLWFLAYFVPVLNIVAPIVWSFKIAKARGKSAWVGAFLLLPITNLFAFLYLAFSDGATPKEERVVEVLCLETA